MIIDDKPAPNYQAIFTLFKIYLKHPIDLWKWRACNCQWNDEKIPQNAWFISLFFYHKNAIIDQVESELAQVLLPWLPSADSTNSTSGSDNWKTSLVLYIFNVLMPSFSTIKSLSDLLHTS